MATVSSNLPKIEVGVAKKITNLISTPAHLKKRLRLGHILKNYFLFGLHSKTCDSDFRL